MNDDLFDLVCQRLEDPDSLRSTLPSALVRLTFLLQSPDVQFQELSQLIEEDPELTSTILQLANAPAMRATREIESVNEAVGRLGTRRLASLMVASKMGALYQVPELPKVAGKIWRHARLTALFAQKVARATRLNKELLFTAALFQPIGAPVILRTLVEVCTEQKVGPSDALIEALLDEFQTEIGRWIGRSWRLPHPILAAINAESFNPHDPNYGRLVLSIRVAEQMARRAQGGATTPEALLHAPTVELLGLSEKACGLLAASVDEVMEQLEAMCDLDTPEVKRLAG